MHKVSLALAVMGASASLLAQNCNTSPPASSIRTRDPWAASFYYGNTANNSLGQFIDINLASPIEITGINVTTYDQGAGNPVVPDQRGNVAEVRIFLIPNTRSGSETNQAAWGIDAAGAGTADGLPEAIAELTVVAWNGDSPIANFKDPVSRQPAPFQLPAGQYGMCIQVIPTNWTGTPLVVAPNVGAIHTIGVSPNPGITWQDQFITLSNDGIQQNGWFNVDAAGALGPNATPNGAQDSVNIEIEYTPAASSAVSVPFGDGCYDRPQAFLEVIPEASAQGGDIENTGWTFLPQGNPQNSYLVVPGPAYATVTATPTNQNLANGTFTSSSSASWDDASVTHALGFTFPHPGGTTTDVTINSNGRVYLGLTTDGSFATNGSNYGSTATFQNGPPSGPLAQWSPFNCDLDQALGGGELFFETLTATSARITWQNVPNWPAVVGQLSSFQITLYDSGQVDVAYGSLWNSAVGSGNDAHVGYSKGDGSPINAAFDLSASIGVLTGDGVFSPQLFVDGRPIAGTSVDVVGDNLMPGTAAGFFSVSFGFTPAPGLDLTSFGLPGCFAHLDVGLVVASVIRFTNPQGELRWTWNVPTGFNGTQVFLQTGALTPGLNAAGAVVSNGLCAKIGT